MVVTGFRIWQGKTAWVVLLWVVCLKTVTLEELGQVRSRGRLCNTSILMYNAGSNLKLFRSNFYNQRTDGTFKVHS